MGGPRVTASLAREATRGVVGAPRVWACYCRLSQAKNDGKGTSLAIGRQCSEIAAYVGRVDPGASVVHFHDDGFSGFKRGLARPGFDEMCTRVAAGEFAAVVAWHADRISRQVEVAGRVVNLCADMGV